MTPYRIDDVLLALGSLECRLQKMTPPTSAREAEFKVFSQFGEDGVIQYLVNRVAVPSTTFVEIGVESYRESNTRFLALHDNWSGLAIDGNRDHLDFILGTELAWKADVSPVQAFVTRDNINDVLRSNGFSGDIGLLSIDVDGMDYWLLDAIDVVRPAILVMEYNALFGKDYAVTVPYDPSFSVFAGHWSGQYFGASLPALEILAGSRGYRLVGGTANGVNCFFVHEDFLGNLPTMTAAEAWRPIVSMTSRGQEGEFTRVRNPTERLRLIRDLELFDVETKEVRTVGQIFGF